MILKVDNIAFGYNSHAVLRQIEFEVARGELLAILGPNGVGKTTLLKCINSILSPHGGTVFVDGQEVFSLNSMEIARRIGYVAQRSEAVRLTAFDAVLLGRRPHISWRVTKKDMAIVNSAINRLNLQPLAMRYIDRMSGGELQKVSIARALVQEPKLLLLDEPISNLDLKNQIQILRLIRQVVKGHAIAAVMTMHNLNMALRFADKYLFLKDGAIYAAGTPNEVEAETIAAVYGVPVEIHTYKGHPMVIPVENPD
jgi:iron complex transport system ATP-binding protein